MYILFPYCTCVQLEERARKVVEQATSSSAVLKLYNKWVEKSQGEAGRDAEKKGGLLKTLKSAIHKPSKDSAVSTTYRTCIEAELVPSYFVLPYITGTVEPLTKDTLCKFKTSLPTYMYMYMYVIVALHF